MLFVVKERRAFLWNALLLAALCAVAIVPGVGDAQEEADSAWEHATLYRDEWGTPHVYAENPRALGFIFGYAQAEDHLEAMLAAYRIANGRAAEVFGESYAASDEFSLKMGHAALANNVFGSLDPLTQDVCEAFSMGVNSWLVEHADRVPPWADGAKPQDILALLHCYLMSMAPFDLPGVYHRAPASVSGNAWAVAPSRSASGEAFLVINPHTHYGSPFLWYEAHLVCQDMDIAGATLFGLPVILQGHNEALGWALTPNQPDFADIYLEPNPAGKRNPKSTNYGAAPAGTPLSRELPGEETLIEMYLLANARPYTVLTPEGPVQRSVPCVDTPRGPLMGMHKGRLCSYLVGGYRDFGAIAQLVEMARARDLGSFQAALAMQQLPCFNVVYADREGNIFYLYNVKTGDKAVADAPPEPPKPEGSDNKGGEPEKRPPAKPPRFIDWTTPVPADDPLSSWRDIIPVRALPAVVNPASGYVQACGSPPWLATENTSLRAAQFPAWFAHDRDSYRAQRIRRLLGMGKRSFRDCQSMLYDAMVPLAAEAVPRLLEIAKQRADYVENAHPDLPAGLDALRSWNFLADTSSPGMTFFHAWWNALQSRSIERYPSAESLLAALARNDADIQDLSLSAAAEAARTMRNEFDSLSVPWGDVHTVTRGDREVPLSGGDSGEPVFVASDEVFEGRKWRVTYGYGFAMVVAFGQQPRAVSMVPFGTSEDPKSPHYSDQLDLMAQRRFKVSRYLFEDVQQNAASARGRLLYLRPKGTEALFTLRAAAPIVARLSSSIDAPADLPENLVPFTLFIATEKVPHVTPMNTHIEIFIPPVLCASQDLNKLAVYTLNGRAELQLGQASEVKSQSLSSEAAAVTAGDVSSTADPKPETRNPRPDSNWVRLDAQQLNLDQRTFVADDSGGPSTYAVLGPSMYRATRLVIPEEKETAAASPIPNPQSPIVNPQSSIPNPQSPIVNPQSAEANLGTSAPRRSGTSRVTWGTPPKRKAQPIAMPGPENLPAIKPPLLELAPPNQQVVPPDGWDDKPQKRDAEKPRKKKEKAARRPDEAQKSNPPAANSNRNFSFGTPPPH
jgi:acyl-homoserine-lactone acylase